MTDTLTPDQRLELARLVGLRGAVLTSRFNHSRGEKPRVYYELGGGRWQSFSPDTNWHHTGKVLEWMVERVGWGEVAVRISCIGRDPGLLRDGKNLRIAICLAALAIGGKEGHLPPTTAD